FAVLLFIRPFSDGLTYSLAQNIFQFAVFGAVIIYAGLILTRRINYQTTGLELPAASFLLISFLATIGSASPYRSEVVYLQYLYYFSFFFLLFQVIAFPPNKKTGIDGHRFILTIVLITAALVCLYGIQQYFWGFKDTLNYMTQQNMLDKIPPEMMARLTTRRAFSTFVYPNIFAAFLITLIPISFALIFSPHLPPHPSLSPPGRARRSFSEGGERIKVRGHLNLSGLLLTVLFIAALSLTKSAGAIIILFLVCLLWLASIWAQRISLTGNKNHGQRLAKKYSPYLVLLGGFIILFFALHTLKMIPHILSLRDRLFYWASSLEIFKERPVLGFGPGSFGIQYARFKIPAAMETQHSHSIFFEILAENGLLGIAAFLWFWVMLLQKSWKGATTGLQKGIFWGIMVLFLHSQVDFDWADPSLATYLFVLPALIPLSKVTSAKLIPLKTAAVPIDKKSEHRRRSLTQISAGLIILVLLVAGFHLGKIHRAEKIYQNGLNLLSTGNGSQGLTLLNKAIEINPKNPAYYAQLGALLYQAGTISKNKIYLQESVSAYQKACKAEPYSASFRFRLGLSAESVAEITGDQRWILLAEQSFKDAVILYPTKEDYRKKIR
ncbi:MAG: O-antigen ligase family protein, partial [Candidatus Omnitrophica bacterium]|nr:O-antigen ligase family protein [Candidatus Omnitrophota bacterium]